jgi:RNA polymerase-binding transcription factor DksA
MTRNGHSSRKWSEHFKTLTLLRDRFCGEMNTRGESARQELPSFNEHMADAATDSYDRDWALAMLSSAQTVLFEIEQALKRIEAGTYGICEATGKAIENERLKAIPWTRFSAEAQAELENKGVADLAHLGDLQSISRVAPGEDQDEEEVQEPAAHGRKRQFA